MARAIFGTHPEIDKKWHFLKIDKVKFFSDPRIFLVENLSLVNITQDFENRRLRTPGRQSNRISKSQKFADFLKNRGYFRKWTFKRPRLSA